MTTTQDQLRRRTRMTHMLTTTMHALRQAIPMTRIIQRSGEWHHHHLQSSRPEQNGSEAADTASLPLRECGGLRLQGHQVQVGELHHHHLCQEAHRLLHPQEGQPAEVHVSEVVKTGQTHGCAEVLTVERGVVVLLVRRGGAGDAAIQAGRAEAAVGQAGQGRRGGDEDIRLPSQADLPRGEKPLTVFSGNRSLIHSCPGPEVDPPHQQEFHVVPRELWV